ncbi:sensor histidine kinase [Prauserella oleivorans]
MPVSPSAARRRAAGLLQWLGLPGVVLLAALLCDLAIVAKASIDSLGTPGIDLLLLPGILGLSACALWARTQPVTAAWTAAVVLVAGTVLIRANAVSAYTTLLPNITFAETVAGLEIVYFCVRAASSGMAFATTAALVTATLVAVAGRDGAMTFRDMLPAFAGGLILLVLVVVPALQYRRGDGGARSALATLLRKQWLLVGVLALTLFFDTYSSAAAGWGGSLVLLTTAAAAVTVVFALRKPFAGALALAAVLALCAISVAMLSRALPFNDIGGFPMTAVVSGMMVSAFLVRHVQPGRAVGAIALLSTVVGLGAVVNVYPHVDLLQSMAVGAVLLLGISVAIGLYLRARDSERTQAVEAAVSEAQTAERMALARELHDVVAHHVTGIVVQAQAARMLAERDPRVVVDALGQIEHAGTDALAAMRRLVRSMRGTRRRAAASSASRPPPTSTPTCAASSTRATTAWPPSSTWTCRRTCRRRWHARHCASCRSRSPTSANMPRARPARGCRCARWARASRNCTSG